MSLIMIEILEEAGGGSREITNKGSRSQTCRRTDELKREELVFDNLNVCVARVLAAEETYIWGSELVAASAEFTDFVVVVVVAAVAVIVVLTLTRIIKSPWSQDRLQSL